VSAVFLFVSVLSNCCWWQAVAIVCIKITHGFEFMNYWAPWHFHVLHWLLSNFALTSIVSSCLNMFTADHFCSNWPRVQDQRNNFAIVVFKNCVFVSICVIVLLLWQKTLAWKKRSSLLLLAFYLVVISYINYLSNMSPVTVSCKIKHYSSREWSLMSKCCICLCCAHLICTAVAVYIVCCLG